MIIKQKKTGNYTVDNLPLHISLWYWKDNILKCAHVRTRDLKGRQDAQIGDFVENWYCRPHKATRMQSYKTLRAYKCACTLSLKSLFPDIQVAYFSVDSEDDNYDTICEII